MTKDTITTIYTGLDFAELNLQLHLDGRFHDLPNTTLGHRRLLKLPFTEPAVRVVCEATGSYQRHVVAALQQSIIAVSVLNPPYPTLCAQPGQRAKTDRIDAAVPTLMARLSRRNPRRPVRPSNKS